MSPGFPIGLRIKSVSGLLERVDDYIHAKYYSAVISFQDGTIALLNQNDIVSVEAMPDDTVDLPANFVEVEERVEGSVVSNAFRLHKPGEAPYGVNAPQLFLVLDRQRMMGIVPTQMGSLLLVERLLTTPLIRPHNALTTLDDAPTTIDDLVGFQDQVPDSGLEEEV